MTDYYLNCGLKVYPELTKNPHTEEFSQVYNYFEILFQNSIEEFLKKWNYFLKNNDTTEQTLVTSFYNNYFQILIFLKRNDFVSVQVYLEKIESKINQLNNPVLFFKFWGLRNEYLLRKKDKLQACYSINAFREYLRSRGFQKEFLIREDINHIRILLDCEQYVEYPFPPTTKPNFST